MTEVQSPPPVLPRAARITHFMLQRSGWVLGLAALLLLVTGYRTALTYSSLKSELEELLPRSAPSVTALTELRRRLPGLRFLGVVIEVDEPAHARDAERFLDGLAGRIRQYPPDLMRGVRLDTSAERRFAERYALQLMEPSDVKRLREAVEARRDFEVSHAMGTDLEDDDDAGAAEKPPELPLEELRHKYETRFGATGRPQESERFVSPDGRDLALLVQTSSQSTGFEYDKRLLMRVKADVQALGGPPRGTRLGYAGDVATRVEETQGLVSDLGVSSLVALLNNPRDAGTTESYAALLGPFWRAKAPACAPGDTIARGDTPGMPLEVGGTVYGPGGGPLAGATVDVWQASPVGLYENQDPSQPDMNLRGRFTTDVQGRYFLRSVHPAGYPVPTDGPCGDLLRAQRRHPFRPAHLHFMVSAPGHRVLITQVFADDSAQLTSDPAFGVTAPLVGHFERTQRDGAAVALMTHDFHLSAGEMKFPHPPIP